MQIHVKPGHPPRIQLTKREADMLQRSAELLETINANHRSRDFLLGSSACRAAVTMFGPEPEARKAPPEESDPRAQGSDGGALFDADDLPPSEASKGKDGGTCQDA